MKRKQFPLRIDTKLYASIEKWAADEFRSVNGHIEYLLREAVRKAGRLNPPSTSTLPDQAESEDITNEGEEE